MRSSDSRSGSLFTPVDLEARVRHDHPLRPIRRIADGALASLSVEFDWDGNDEMDEAQGDGWAQLQDDGSLAGEIRFHGGDDITFTARRWATSSTAC